MASASVPRLDKCAELMGKPGSAVGECRQNGPLQRRECRHVLLRKAQCFRRILLNMQGDEPVIVAKFFLPGPDNFAG